MFGPDLMCGQFSFNRSEKNDQCVLLFSRFKLALSLTLAKAGESFRESFEKVSANRQTYAASAVR
jgi:hypothetical protein